jgi:hypothetical protein
MAERPSCPAHESGHPSDVWARTRGECMAFTWWMSPILLATQSFMLSGSVAIPLPQGLESGICAVPHGFGGSVRLSEPTWSVWRQSSTEMAE